MKGFFETIAAFKNSHHMKAAWVIEGEGAGKKAILGWKEQRFVPVYLDADFPEECAAALSRLPQEYDGLVSLGERKVFLEQISGRRKLVICGAGHVSMSVIRIAVLLGFEVTVIEDREEYAHNAQKAGAHHVICRPFTDALEEFESDPATSFVIMTRAHSHDLSCLRCILKKPYSYAGMMGSRSRTGEIRRQMLAEGFDAEKVKQLHMPIGLPIGARTPEEIAVSVIAELVQITNSKETGEGFPEGMLEEMAGSGSVGGPSAVLAMIVEKRGEAPRRPGTKMLVRADGSFLGTVGGGYAEAQILKSALEILGEKSCTSRLVQINMVKGAMYCGGEITVCLLPC